MLGNTFLTNSSFQVFLNTNPGQLQAVAIGTDNRIDQMIQYESGGHDSWSSPKQAGTLPTGSPQFTLGIAATYTTSTAVPVYSGFNSQSAVGANPLMYSSPTYSGGTATNLTLGDQPVGTSPPIMVSNYGAPQLICQSSTTPGQVVLLSQDTGATNFWKAEQLVGSQNSDLSAQMPGIVNNGSVAPFQYGQRAGQRDFVNYLPG